MMVAGIGCRSGVTAEQVDAALEAALRQTAVVGVCPTGTAPNESFKGASV